MRSEAPGINRNLTGRAERLPTAGFRGVKWQGGKSGMRHNAKILKTTVDT